MIYHKSVKTKIKTFFSRAILAMLMSVFCFTCTVGCSVFDGLKPTPPKQENQIGSSDPPPKHPDHNPPKDDDDDDDDNFDPDNDDQSKKDEITGGISVDYVKVLRKPLSYDFSGNVTDKDGGEGTNREYYYNFGNDILSWLFKTYGNFNTGFDTTFNNIFEEYYQKTNNEKMNELSQDFESANKDSYLYWYDALRYQITSVTPVSYTHLRAHET